jgi:hypothetical protein
VGVKKVAIVIEFVNFYRVKTRRDVGILSGSKPRARERSVIEKNNFLLRKARQVRTQQSSTDAFFDRPTL